MLNIFDFNDDDLDTTHVGVSHLWAVVLLLALASTATRARPDLGAYSDAVPDYWRVSVSWTSLQRSEAVVPLIPVTSEPTRVAIPTISWLEGLKAM